MTKSGEASLSAKLWLRLETGAILDNGGDTVFLQAPTGEIVDSVTYPGGLSGKSYGRTEDGGGSWATLTEVTAGGANVGAGTAAEEQTSESEDEIYEYKLRVLEFYPCPLTGEKEWARLKNLSETAVNLLGFQWRNGSGASRKLSDVTLTAGASAKIEFTGGLAPNTGGQILLLDPAGETQVEINYEACSSKGVTLVENDGKWLENGTASTEETEEEDAATKTAASASETTVSVSTGAAAGTGKAAAETSWRQTKIFKTPQIVKRTKAETASAKNDGQAEKRAASASAEVIKEEVAKLSVGEKVGLWSGTIVVIIVGIVILGDGLWQNWEQKEKKDDNDDDEEKMADY